MITYYRAPGSDSGYHRVKCENKHWEAVSTNDQGVLSSMSSTTLKFPHLESKNKEHDWSRNDRFMLKTVFGGHPVVRFQGIRPIPHFLFNFKFYSYHD